MSTFVPCPGCNGTGDSPNPDLEPFSHYCAVCKGDGYVDRDRLLSYLAAHGGMRHTCHMAHCANLKAYAARHRHPSRLPA